MPTPTADTLLQRYRGVGPGFDFWRMFLSASVIFLHSFHVSRGVAAGGSQVDFLNPFFAAILPIFFGLSGFLVAGSALRTGKVGTFLIFRGLRLVPALAVEVTLSALILGPLLTTVPLRDYFTDHEFFAYFGNIIGRVRYNLPGLFAGNPVPRTVNENLWTLHAELECYVIMACAMFAGILHRRRLTLALWVLATTVMFVLSLTNGYFLRSSLFPTSVFVYAFCTGVVAFVWRDRIPVSAPLFVAALIGSFALYYVKPLSFLAVIPMIYVMIWIGLQPALQFSLLKKGDYSYGLYLYGFVIQQTLVLLLPGLRVWWFVFPASLLLTLVFAVTSWHLIEKPALKLKKLVSRRSANTPGTPHAHEQRPAELIRLDAAKQGIGEV